MAGSSSGWFKSPSSPKKKVFVSVAAIKSYAGSTVSIAEFKAKLRDSGPDGAAQFVDLVASRGDQPKGQAKPKPPVLRKVGGVPVRAQADIDTMGQANITRLRERAASAYGGAAILKKIKAMSDPELASYIKKIMSDIIAKTDVSMRVPNDVLPMILSGGFLNQHATRKSGGDLDPSGRMKAEANMHGLPIGGSPGDYPVYGYLSEKGSPLSIDTGAMVYGDTRITFKDSVRDRTSFTIGDSLYDAMNGKLIASPIGDPSAAAGDGMLHNVLDKIIKKYPVSDITKGVGYWETQIHGPTTAADIAKVSFSTHSPDPAVIAQLDALGIPWEIG